MKIALIGRYGEGEILSGPEKVARNLFKQISLLNPNSIFLTYFFKSGKKRKAKQFLFGCEVNPENQDVKKLGIINLISTIISYKPDIVHLITFERFELVILLLKIFLKFKIVYTIHGIYKYERSIFFKKPSIKSDLKDIFLEKMIFAKSDKLVFLSDQMFNLAQKYYKIDKSKVTIIPNGVSTPTVSKEKNLDLSNGVEIVFYNGLEVSRERGLKKLIYILSDEQLNAFRLSVLGSPVELEFRNVTFQSPLSDDLLFNFLINKHVFIDNLDYMPFSILALEAMALGLVLIVSDKSGISSFIKNGENGFVYNSENAEEISAILTDIINKKYNLNLISNNAKKINEQLSWQNIAAEYISVYKKLL